MPEMIALTARVPPPHPAVDRAKTMTFSSPEIVSRRSAVWDGIEIDSVELRRPDLIECEFDGPRHLLIATERGHRYEGESSVDGLPKSSRREFSQTLTFAPAGHRFHGWQKPRVLSRVTNFYIDPHFPLLGSGSPFTHTELRPQLFFVDSNLWTTTQKLKAQMQQPESVDRGYVEALSTTLAHELIRASAGLSPPTLQRGGLSAWQQRNVADYIVAHLREDIPLREMAQVAGLSPYHFARAFKQSFGVPPHRYHLALRMERAKLCLEDAKASITEIGAELGFSETSSFSTAFRKFTGVAPSEFRRVTR
jgi:AraC family transcriptional regulator